MLLYCRPGFEPEAAAEVADHAARAGLVGYPQTERNSGYVRFHLARPADDALRPTWQELIFARQILQVIADIDLPDPTDRITPMLEALAGTGLRFGDLIVEHPDSDAGRPLAGLARSFGNALRPALRKVGLLGSTVILGRPTLHVCFVSGASAVLALSHPERSAPWPQGIPRLRLHRDAPSRSALKLEEALLVLLTADERATFLKPGMKAADLGAAPGGWSWVLAREGVHVTAIDNGPLGETARAQTLIRHQRADGFSWQPPHPMDWLVCDMVEQPSRVAARMADWFAQRWCRRAIFNLKLPMKKRYAEVQANLSDFVALCAADGVHVEWRAKQLYHDREEITVFAHRP
ncbi:23S rRNA (cytidine(2498)-2'-O)-methyltransferase RlmM [Chiayiivirga flava]|uniref:Ribosomal RNA large subunit methyltransferase M n=1 Tax=Chiayiivirga flava TaxID=659595 RepID=A0A7W8G0R6_9GAMM|nr:23S rRNA (cytidine2498-2'-O)-methyltransferase [Chiayiivirga flava]